MVSDSRTFEERLEDLLQTAGADLEADPIMDGDLAEHVWVAKQPAIYGCDAYTWTCERCGRVINVIRTSSGEHETISEAMEREGITRRCSDEVATSVHES